MIEPTPMRVLPAGGAKLCCGLGVSEGHNTIRMGGCASRKMSAHYLEVISLIERLHRQFLEVVKLELDRLRVHDLNNVQALMLYNMGMRIFRSAS